MIRFLPLFLIALLFIGCKAKNNGPQPKKPVIYLYPTKVMDVSVGLDFHGDLTAVYPSYDEQWLVQASPDGKMVDLSDAREHEYLFYEGISNDGVYQNYNFNEGFCVAKNDVVDFLESNLDKIGLNNREANDMITFWMAELTQNEYVLIRFQLNDDCDKIADLNIFPKPDSELRIMMNFKQVHEFKELQPQVFSTFSRDGFTVVEWGGTNLSEFVAI
jgi:hypothetical protein